MNFAHSKSYSHFSTTLIPYKLLRQREVRAFLMANPTPLASCPSCSDTPLAIATSAISFLTFLYAVTVGLFYYYGLAKSSPKEIHDSIQTLLGSIKEFNRIDRELEPMLAAQAEYHISQEMKAHIRITLGRLQSQNHSLQRYEQRMMAHHTATSASPHPHWFHRISYLYIRNELQQRITEKDQLMADLRDIQQRSVYKFPVSYRIHL